MSGWTARMHADDEWEALWRAVFGEPPFIRAEAGVMARVLVGFMPAAPPYEPGRARPFTS